MTPEDDLPDEPVVTGAVQTILQGDIEESKMYIRTARRMLGKVRATMGINARINGGEQPGFYSQVAQFGNVSVKVMSNNGMDTIVINSRANVEQQFYRAESSSTTSDGNAAPVYAAAGMEHVHRAPPPPELKQPPPQDPEEEREKEEPQPYMWVGIRVQADKIGSLDAFGANALAFWYSTIVVMTEPGDDGGVIANEMSLWGDRGEGIYPLDLGVQEAEWAENYFWVPSSRHYFFANFPQEDVAQQPDPVRFTRNGLRLYTQGYSRDDNKLFGPFDPEENLDTDEQYRERVVQIDPNTGSKVQHSLWDWVIVLDPYEGMTPPTSFRPYDLTLGDLISEKTEIAGEAMVLSGAYRLFLGGAGQDCHSSLVPFPYNYGWDSDLTYYPAPLPIEVEVRLGKEPDTIVTVFELEIPAYSDYYRRMWPFGDLGSGQLSGEAAALQGPNGFEGNWWNGVIEIDVRAQTADMIEPADLGGNDPFGGGSLDITCERIPWYIYVQIFQPQSAYAAGEYPTEVAEHVWFLIDNARKGQYGSVSIHETTQADIEAAAAQVIDPDTGEGLYRMDVETGIFTEVAVPPEDPSLTYDTGSNYTWEYVYRWEALKECKGFAKVRLGFGNPVYAGFTFEEDPDDVKDTGC